MMPQNNTHSRHAAAAIAQDVITGKLEILEGCKQLASLTHELTNDWLQDEDFLVIVSVASEADDLPTGHDRQWWNKDALARADQQISKYENQIKDLVHKACWNIVSRFADSQ